MPPCATVPLVAQDTCIPAIGGAAKAFVAKYSEITSFTVAAGLITAIVMDAPGSWQEWNPSQDRSAYLNATGQDPSKNVFFHDFIGLLKYSGTSTAAIKAANSITPCCDLVVIWLFQNGSTIITGVEFDAAGTGIKPSLEPARYVPSMFSGQGDEESKMEFLIKSKGRNIAVADPAIIDEDYILAL